MVFRRYASYHPTTDINFVLVHGLDGDDTAFINEETSKSLLDCLRSGFPRSNIIKYIYPNNSIGMMTSKEPLPVDARALNFLQGLQNELDDKSPIIFIGHSMGGLVIKQALITSKDNNKHKNICDRTTSVAFYATPHTGSTLANICNKLQLPVTIAVKQLKHDNPYLVNLKQEFNQLVTEKNMKILSLVEAQKHSILNTKIVDYKSAICGLDEKYEEQHKLDYDHTQIQRPSSLQDRRYKDLYYFITKNVFKSNEITNYKPKNISNDIKEDTKDNDDNDDNDDDEKEGFIDSKKILCFDPKYDTSDDTSIALKGYEQHPNLQNFTALLAVTFAKESKNFKQQDIENAFKDDILKQNTKILNHLLKTKELVEYIDEKHIKSSIKLSMKYWDLLKESKSIIADKKDQIDILLDTFKTFQQIMRKKQKGNILSEDEIDFVGSVGEDIAEWFEENPDLQNINNKWHKLHAELNQQHAWWKGKLTKITEKVKQAKALAKKKLEECSSLVGKVVMGIGLCCVGAGILIGALIATPFAIVGGIVVGIVGVVAAGIGAYDVYKTNQKQKQLKLEIVKSESYADIVRKHTTQVVKAFQEMVSDASKMDKLFGDLVQKLRSPKKESKKVEKMHLKQKYNYIRLDSSCKSIIKSLTTLEKICKDILDTIDKAQDRFHSDD